MVTDIKDAIFAAALAARADDRKYLGMSVLGHGCPRRVWYDFRKFTPIGIDGRVCMIFEFGHTTEKLVTRWLRDAGYRLEHAHPDKQEEFSALGGWVKGHSDGRILYNGEWMQLEVKSANKKKFQGFTLAGIRSVYPIYYAQAQLYMHHSGLRKCMFIVVCKDNSDIYSEIIDYDRPTAEAILRRARGIILATTPPERAFEATDDTCRWCDYRVQCRTPEAAIHTTVCCLNCQHLSIHPDTLLAHCQHPAHKVRIYEPYIGCKEYIRLPWA